MNKCTHFGNFFSTKRLNDRVGGAIDAAAAIFWSKEICLLRELNQQAGDVVGRRDQNQIWVWLDETDHDPAVIN